MVARHRTVSAVRARIGRLRASTPKRDSYQAQLLSWLRSLGRGELRRLLLRRRERLRSQLPASHAARWFRFSAVIPDTSSKWTRGVR
jgi:hypothetical protein